MKCVLILCVFVSISAAAVIPEDAEATIVNYENTNDGTGNYKFRFDASNGISREETGRLVNVGQDNEHIVVEGYYTYKDPEGNYEYVFYKADENGFQIIQPPTVEKVTFSLPSSVVATLLG